MRNIKTHFLFLVRLLFHSMTSQHGGIPRLNEAAPVIRMSWADDDGGLAELDGLVAEGLTVVSSIDGSGGFTSMLTGGSSEASVNGREDGMTGSGVGTSGSSIGLVTFAFLDLSWPLREML